MENKFVIIVGRGIRTHREAIGMDQATLADKIGKSRQTVNTWEGKAILKLSEKDAEKVAHALKIKLEALLGDDKSPLKFVSRENKDNSQDTRSELQHLKQQLASKDELIASIRNAEKSISETVGVYRELTNQLQADIDRLKKELEECKQKHTKGAVVK